VIDCIAEGADLELIDAPAELFLDVVHVWGGGETGRFKEVLRGDRRAGYFA
jgi:hypothetical protein